MPSTCRIDWPRHRPRTRWGPTIWAAILRADLSGARYPRFPRSRSFWPGDSVWESLPAGSWRWGRRSREARARWLAKTALAVPTLVTALVLSTVFGAGIPTVAAALLATSWAPYALTIAALFDRVRGEPYWLASRALGTTLPGAVYRHMLPNVWPALGALAGADAGRAVILVASLGFIGLSTDTGRPEWGAMIHEYRMFLFTEPRLVLAPILTCALVCVLLHGLLDRKRSEVSR